MMNAGGGDGDGVEAGRDGDLDRGLALRVDVKGANPDEGRRMVGSSRRRLTGCLGSAGSDWMVRPRGSLI